MSVDSRSSKPSLLSVFVLPLLALAGCLTIGEPKQPPPRDGTSLSEADIKLMIARFGPVIYLRNDEKYVMDDPEDVLDQSASLCWGKLRDENEASFSCTDVQKRRTSSDTLLDDVRTVEESIRSMPDQNEYKYWLSFNESAFPGNMQRAQALVHVLASGRHATEIQFWFFYPFNGPARVRARASSRIGDDNWLDRCGRHQGDWELVSIIVSNTATQLQSVYMSRHSGGEIFQRWEDGTYHSASDTNTTLEILGPGFLKDMWQAHPVVYAGISSHAHYPSAGNHYYERVWSYDYKIGTASADLFDRTEAGRAFRAYEPYRYRIVSSDLPGVQVSEPKWLAYIGRWGPSERLTEQIKFATVPLYGKIPVYPYKEVGKGPSGPKRKPEWNGAFR